MALFVIWKGICQYGSFLCKTLLNYVLCNKWFKKVFRSSDYFWQKSNLIGIRIIFWTVSCFLAGSGNRKRPSQWLFNRICIRSVFFELFVNSSSTSSTNHYGRSYLPVLSTNILISSSVNISYLSSVKMTSTFLGNVTGIEQGSSCPFSTNFLEWEARTGVEEAFPCWEAVTVAGSHRSGRFCRCTDESVAGTIRSEQQCDKRKHIRAGEQRGAAADWYRVGPPSDTGIFGLSPVHKEGLANWRAVVNAFQNTAAVANGRDGR